MAKHKLNLNANQIHLLKIIYKFRFATTDQIAKYKVVSKRAVNNALTILLDQGYIARRYDSSYKLLGKSARYYLAPKALKLLRDQHGLNEGVLHSRYKDKSVSEPFIKHNLSVFNVCLKIKLGYPDAYNIFTKVELADYDYFPQPLPDLYMRRINPEEDKPTNFMIDFFEDTLAFIIQKRVDQYIKRFEDDGWIDKVYPNVLLICSNSRIEEKIQKYIEKQLDNIYIDEYEMAIKACVINDFLDLI